MNVNGIIILLFLTLACCVSGCNAENQVLLSGKTMGTTWRIVIASDDKQIPDNLKAQITARLDEINWSMSLFNEESELSHFNESVDKICVSDDFISVYQVARNLYRLTDGAWDGTIGPLVNLWGFGNIQGKFTVPSKKMIQQRLKDTGFNKIKLIEGQCLLKDKAEVILDLGSVAKGYGVDAVAGLLRKQGINNFLVEIGGEVYASGRKSGKKWRVGIKTPEFVLMSDKIFNAVEIENMAIATSGDYRNFREADGRLYSHIIHPVTGMPVRNQVASVSVLADNTAFADGLATALMVMGATEGLKLVNTLTGVECLIIVRAANDKFNTHTSLGWN